MDMGRYLVEAHLREGRSVAELASAHGLHRSWIYKLLARYRADGEAGLAPRSRRPRSSPAAVSTVVEDEIVRLRKQLSEDGLDAGAATIHWHLGRRGGPVPSVSTIWRVLKRRGFVVPEPHKRPKSSLIRFEADLPNECWQSDMTHWALGDGTGAEIVNFIDDHSRLCVASVAVRVTTAVDVAEVFAGAMARYGAPAAVLSDNGCIYTARHRGGKVVLETMLESLGIDRRLSRPYHPQTCGKVERFHQTMKRFLAAQDPAADLAGLQAQIDRFVAYYNTSRPHRSLARRTPAEVYGAKVKARPHGRTQRHLRVRRDRVDQAGRVTLRYESRLLHIGVGRAHARRRVMMLVADLDVRIIDTDTGELIRQLTLDPACDYQRLGSG